MIPDEVFYDQAESKNDLVWRVCQYLLTEEDRECEHCPARQHNADGRPAKKMCRMIAEETVALVMEGLALEGEAFSTKRAA